MCKWNFPQKNVSHAFNSTLNYVRCPLTLVHCRSSTPRNPIKQRIHIFFLRWFRFRKKKTDTIFVTSRIEYAISKRFWLPFTVKHGQMRKRWGGRGKPWSASRVQSNRILLFSRMHSVYFSIDRRNWHRTAHIDYTINISYRMRLITLIWCSLIPSLTHTHSHSQSVTFPYVRMINRWWFDVDISLAAVHSFFSKFFHRFIETQSKSFSIKIAKKKKKKKQQEPFVR